ncbi:MAG: hypothetical protein H0T73_23580, partial [Ardenticatenales bacterium]|nr:hypothetical protein [Ardenticatenales bacterium]
QQEVYETSGSWSRIFDRGSFQNRFPLLVWALLLELLGLLALPYLLTIAKGLPGRGYTFAKPLGLLLVAWLVWLLASLHLVTFSVGGIALALGLIGLGAVGLLWVEARQRDIPLRALPREWWRQEGRRFLISEGVFWLFFTLVLLVRWANPDIWHPDLGGERPMDTAYLNAVIKSAYFPPMDPWFAGGYINYYYFGFVLVGVLIKFTGILTEIAYNLIIPTLFAMLAAGVWGAALALLVPLRRGDAESETSTSTFAYSFATLAAVLVAIAGNLGELKVLLEGLPQLSTLTFRSGLPGLEKLVKALDGLLRGVLLHGQTLPGRMEWPYWNATRTIPDTINEFPWFTFLYADLHAHMMALPYTALAIGLALAFLRAPLRESRVAEGLRLGLMALVIGALWPINTWDFPTYALVAFAGLGLREWRRDGSITLRALGAVAWRWALILLLGRLLFQPFHSAYGAAYNAVEMWSGQRTRLAEYLVVHGLFLFSIFFALINDLLFGRGHNGVVRLLSLRLRTFGRRARAGALYRFPMRPTLATMALYWSGILLMSVAILMLLVGWVVPSLTLSLLTFALLLFFREKPQPLWQMVLFFIMLGLGLTLAVEIVVLKGDIGRMNTVFKFYLQVWVLWGIAAALGAARVAESLPRWLPEWRAIWRTGFTTLFAVAMLYPIFATHAKINDRFDRAVGPSLNGAAFMEKATYHDKEHIIELRWDAEAIRWVQETLPGSPTILEINTFPRLYGWGNRFAMWTGNPSVIGWDWHQRQQRAAANPAEINQRITDVQNIYSTSEADRAHEMMLKYGVEYFVVGGLERAYAQPEGMAKFEAARGRLWDLVYENPEVRIYRVISPETVSNE